VLSPHWRCLDVRLDNPREWVSFKLNFKHGIYNAGFLGVNRKSENFLSWWLDSCVKLPGMPETAFLYDDQKFLDLVPAYFKEVHVLQHQGCNVSEWNEGHLERQKSADGSIQINGAYPLVFAHFARSYETVKKEGRDPLMVARYEVYQQELEQNIRFLKELGVYPQKEIVEPITLVQPIRPITEVKKWVYQQAKKIVDRAEKQK
jgi:hypothetical protein